MAYTPHRFVITEPLNRAHHLSLAMDAFNANQWFPLHRVDTDFQLYHYTTADTLNRIVESRSLYHTSAKMLNDPAEIQNGIGIINQVIAAKQLEVNDASALLFLDGLSIMENYLGYIYTLFVACFCESPDVDEMWRKYAAQGTGYCLGFNFSNDTLYSDLGESSNPMRIVLRKVIYEPDIKQALVESFLSQVIDSIHQDAEYERRFDDFEQRHLISMKVAQAQNTLIEMALTFKAEIHQNEQERRLLRLIADYHESKKTLILEHNGVQTPFRPTHLFNPTADDSTMQFPLVQIIAGPNLDPIQLQSDSNQLVENMRESEIPINLKSNIQITHAG